MMGHLFLENSLIYSFSFLENSLIYSFSFLFIPFHSLKIPWIIPFDYFSFLAGTFFEKFSPFFLHISILLSTFAIARIYMWSIPHEQRARIYVQARPKYLLRLWAYFLPVPFRIEPRESPFVHVEHSIYNVGCNQDIRRFAFHVFFSPLWWITCKF